ncbi:MAG: ABC transporter substrate-binding protein [Anaerolineales bacterium]|nr:ABC transporter substrate-binding protein [Anaerolineales bacterium]
MKRITRILLSGMILAVFLAACGSGSEPEEIITEGDLIEVILPLGYIPNIQFAPLYVAVEKGYFKEAGFDVSFDYRFETDGLALVGQGELPFAVVSGEQVLLARAQGVPVKYVVSWYQNFPVGVTAKVESGIRTPEDLVGKSVGLPGLYGANYIGLIALLNAAGVDPADLTLESIGYNQVEALVSDQQDAVAIYVTNEPVQLRAQGYEIDEIHVSDYVQLVGNGIITNEELIATDPQLVERFVKAFLEGLADAIADPEEAYQLSLNHVEGLADADKTIQMEVLRRSIGYWEAEPLGKINPDGWDNMLEVLLSMELLAEPIPVEEAYTTEFVK